MAGNVSDLLRSGVGLCWRRACRRLVSLHVKIDPKYTRRTAPGLLCPTPLKTDALLPDAIAHHTIRALRLGVGDALVLFDGEGGEHTTASESIDRAVRVRIEAFDAVERESARDIALIQALLSGEKMDWVVQKAVEPGAHESPACAL